MSEPKQARSAEFATGDRVILSIFPLEQTLELRHNGVTKYICPAATPGTHVLIHVPDTFAWCKNWTMDPPILYQAPVPAQVVAENLVNAWSARMIGAREGLTAGVMIIAGETPTTAEIEEVKNRQEAYFRQLISIADDFETKGERHNITDLHRVAANWMGVQGRAWAKPLRETRYVPCPNCLEDIREGARICRFCQSDLVKAEVNNKPGVEPKALRPVALKPDAA